MDHAFQNVNNLKRGEEMLFFHRTNKNGRPAPVFSILTVSYWTRLTLNGKYAP